MLSAWDTQLLVAINIRLHQTWLWVWMDVVTQLGDYRVALGLAAVAGALAWRRRRREVLAGGVGLLLAMAGTWWLKQWINRPRPAELMPILYVVPDEPGSAFPSGHTTTAFALAACLHHWWPRGRIVWWSAAVIVGGSRVYLGLHFPSDCLAGAVVGMSAVWLAQWFGRRRQVR